MSQDDVKVLEAGATQPRARVFADLRENQEQALIKHEAFFLSDTHVTKVEQVLDIVENFFTVHKAIYVNKRENRGKPFTVIKVEKPQFPRLSQTQIQTTYRDPLQVLGVEIVFSKASNSYLFRIR